MGGSALKQYGIETVRLESKDYFRVIDEVIDDELRDIFTCDYVKAYSEKPSHGDLDVVLMKEDPSPDTNGILDLIRNKYQPRMIHRNSNTFSFDYQNFQVDFIFHPPEVYYPALDYYDYSPSGNAIGKIAHQFGLSYGHEGLKYIIREEHVGAPTSNNSHVMEQVILSTNSDDIHDFLGLYYGTYVQGFKTEKDIFKWICSSKYFNPNLFSFEAMNHRARVRDVKRPDYNRLMNFIELNKNSLPSYERKIKSEYLPWICETFPILSEALDRNKIKYQENQAIKGKFDGRKIQELTGLQGSELGKIIKNYKGNFHDYSKFLLNNSAESIEKDFLEWYSSERVLS